MAVVAAATLPMLARAGRPAGKPIVTAATLPATVQAADQDVITRALGSLGIAGIDRDIGAIVAQQKNESLSGDLGHP
jgi:hypothetical protein